MRRRCTANGAVKLLEILTLEGVWLGWAHIFHYEVLFGQKTIVGQRENRNGGRQLVGESVILQLTLNVTRFASLSGIGQLSGTRQRGGTAELGCRRAGQEVGAQLFG